MPASFRFARYTVFKSPIKDETAVHGYGLSLSVFVVLMFVCKQMEATFFFNVETFV